jgi:uncharacterized protein YyaL (SSP411 family)
VSKSAQTEKSNNSTLKPNRLIDESSTYLQQHAYNPVDWYPWNAEALAKARSEDKPILLSIGYSACHWCHVMAHESFEDADTASLMNKFFVNIKVDREERTDLDEIYMKAVQMMTGHGGWPMTVFLTPDLKPFYGGTYFPPQDRHGMPSFKKLLIALSDAWKEQREDIVHNSNELTNHLIAMDKLPSEGMLANAVQKETITAAVQKLANSFDSKWGGFGGAPKFPHTFSLNLAMRYIKNGEKLSLRETCVEVVRTSLDRMADGGMHDQLGGGFARYSTDRLWLVPHFEKMLYDNALLAQSYIDGYLLFGREYWKRVARRIFEFVSNELTTEDGAFYSSLDADSEGEEGKFYVWNANEVSELLDKQEQSFITDVFGITAHGNFEHGTNVLHLSRPLEQMLATHALSETDFWQRVDRIGAKLLATRAKRVRPGRDEKVLTSWNSLMITAFVSGYRAFGEEKFLQCAKKAARFILNNLVTEDGRLLRTWGRGGAKLSGYLDDYAYFAEALMELAAVEDDPDWLVNAARFMDAIVSRFWDSTENSLCFTSVEHEALLTKPKSFYDGAVPSGVSVSLNCLLRLAKLTGRQSYSDMAEKLLSTYAPFAGKYPDQFSNFLCAMDFHLAKGEEMVWIEREQTKRPPSVIQEHVRILNKGYIPSKVVLFDSVVEGHEGTKVNSAFKQHLGSECPLLTDKRLIDDKPTLYICQDYTCEEPLNDIGRIEKRLEELALVDISLQK